MTGWQEGIQKSEVLSSSVLLQIQSICMPVLRILSAGSGLRPHGLGNIRSWAFLGPWAFLGHWAFPFDFWVWACGLQPLQAAGRRMRNNREGVRASSSSQRYLKLLRIKRKVGLVKADIAKCAKVPSFTPVSCIEAEERQSVNRAHLLQRQCSPFHA